MTTIDHRHGDFVFAVHHRAAPQGSKDLMTKADGGKYMKESSNAVKPFRQKVKRAALGDDGRPMATFKGPVLVGIEFEFKQAKSNTDPYPIGKNIGDIDKLTRAVLDGIAFAGVIEDDRYVVGLLGVTKTWGEEDRVIITVRSAAEPGQVQSVVDFRAGLVNKLMASGGQVVGTETHAVVDFSGCACDMITCRECSARRGVLPARLDESGPPRFLPLPRNPFDDVPRCVGCGSETCYAGSECAPH